MQDIVNTHVQCPACKQDFKVKLTVEVVAKDPEAILPRPGSWPGGLASGHNCDGIQYPLGVDPGNLAKEVRWRSLAAGPNLEGRAQICTPDEAYQALAWLSKRRKEYFVALYLDGRRRLIHEEIVSVGTLTSTLVHPREVFQPGIACGAASILVAHNHPSGDPGPSAEDLALTRRLRDAGRMISIELVDHLIIGRPGSGRAAFVSLRQTGDI